MNYAELVSTVEDYCENTFPTADMNTFIQIAEQNIYNTVQLPSLRRNVTGNLTASNQYLAAPFDFLSVFSLAVIKPDGDYEYLLNKDVNFIRQAYANPSDTGLPRHYAIFGPKSDNANELTFIVGPTPDISYDVELHYFYYPTSIVVAGTSWIGDNFESVLINGTMVEAITYMKGEQDLINLYRTRYQESLILLKNLGDGKLRQDAYRDGQIRIKAQ